MFDYRYTVHRGKNSHTYHQTVAAFRDLPNALPEFQLRPENLLLRIGAAFGFQDIDFDRHPAFSKRYLLRGPQEAAIRRLFTDAVIETIMDRKPLAIEASGAALIAYRAGRRVKPDALGEFIEEAREIRAALLGEKRGAGVRYRVT